MTEDEMVGWHYQLHGDEFEQTLGVGDGQGGLACCDPWGRKESDTTERLNWTELRMVNAFPKFLIDFALEQSQSMAAIPLGNVLLQQQHLKVKIIM